MFSLKACVVFSFGLEGNGVGGKLGAGSWICTFEFHSESLFNSDTVGTGADPLSKVDSSMASYVVRLGESSKFI